MAYDAEHIRKYYDRRAEREWNRLEQDLKGQLEFRVHMAAIEETVPAGSAVLELGGGAGRFSKELAARAGRLVITDISATQLEFNRSKLEELGLADEVESWQQVDICDLSAFGDQSFDAVLCIGAPLNYVFEKEPHAMKEMMRVLRPGGHLLLGVMSLAGTVRYLLGSALDELVEVGAKATDWLLRTGKQDGIHYKVENEHYCHMMRSEDVFRLAKDAGGIIEKTWCAGFLATAAPDALKRAAGIDWLWERLIEAELDYCRSAGLLEAGTHMIFAIGKP